MTEKLTPKEFLALPVDERKKLLREQAQQPEIIRYYLDLWRDEQMMQDKGMME